MSIIDKDMDYFCEEISSKGGYSKAFKKSLTEELEKLNFDQIKMFVDKFDLVCKKIQRSDFDDETSVIDTVVASMTNKAKQLLYTANIKDKLEGLLHFELVWEIQKQADRAAVAGELFDKNILDNDDEAFHLFKYELQSLGKVINCVKDRLSPMSLNL